MSKTFWGFLTLGLLGGGAAIIYNVIGQTIDENGMLNEPFFLIPLSYLFMVVGFTGALIVAAKRKLSYRS